MVVPEASINNIMGGLESTAGVRLHNHRRKLKQRFDIVRKLGQGTYGKVQLGINKETGQEVAIKTIKKCKIETEADLIRIRREIQIMSSVQHPNIIHIYEVFENREKMVLVMEYAAGGELYDYISEKKVLNEAEARRIFRQIATAVYYCHKHKICHRDLKLENVLLDEHGSAKIADFGLSNVFDETHLLGTFCGSPLYASPEIVKGTPYHGPEVDCWSLGVLLYTLVYGSMPFDGSNFKRLVRQISQGDYFEPKKPSPASPLIGEMLKVQSSRRADIVAICSHWWIDANEQVPCLEVAEELANQTPVRLDLLLSLAPSACAADKLLIPEGTLEEEGAPVTDCPVRSQSLGSLAVTSQPIDFLVEEAQRAKRSNETKPESPTTATTPASTTTATTEKRKEKARSRRRERSASRNRKRDESTPESDSPNVDAAKPHRKASKSKKKQQPGVEEGVEGEQKKPVFERISGGSHATFDVDDCGNVVEMMRQDGVGSTVADLKASEVAEILETIDKLEEDYKAEEAALVAHGDELSLDAFKPEVTGGTPEVAGGTADGVPDVERKESGVPSVAGDQKMAVNEEIVAVDENTDTKKEGSQDKDKEEEEKKETKKPAKQTTDTKKQEAKKATDEEKAKPMERRKSKIFETAEKFSNLSQETPAKSPPKKVFLPGVKVSDAKRAYERKSSLASSASSFVKPASRRNSSASADAASVDATSMSVADFDRKFSLASTVALNKLVEDVEKLSRDEEEKEKKEKKEREKMEEKAREERKKEEVKAEDLGESADTRKAPLSGEKRSPEKIATSNDEKVAKATPTAAEKAKQKSASPPGEKKRQNAVQVISNAIDTNNGEKKAATLPRRKTSRAEIKLTTPKPAKPEYRSEVEHMVAAAAPLPPTPAPAPTPTPTSVQRSEVVFPVAAATAPAATVSRSPVRSATLPPPSSLPTPTAQQPPRGHVKPLVTSASSAGASSPREHIIPIRFESDERSAKSVSGTGVACSQSMTSASSAAGGPQKRPLSRTNSKSLSRQSTGDSDSGSVVSQGEPIRKSPREVIIPIAVEGGGFVTPNMDAVNRMSSLTESDDESASASAAGQGHSGRGFGLHSTRRPIRQLETADSVSSDEDDDNFEILTAESLFSALLSKVRNLTHRLNTEETRPPGFPRLFNHHSLFENSPSFSSRRLSEARSFSRAGDVPWRRSMSRDSSSTLPRDFSTRSAIRQSMLSSLRNNESESTSPSSSSSSKLPRRSPSLHRQTSEDKPPLYRPKLATRSVVPETATTDAALVVKSPEQLNSEVRSSKSPRQSVGRDDDAGRNFSSYLHDRQSVIREVVDEAKRNVSPFCFDEKQHCSSNSDLSDSYKTAKNSRSVSIENNNSFSRKYSGELKSRNSFSEEGDKKSISSSRSELNNDSDKNVRAARTSTKDDFLQSLSELKFGYSGGGGRTASVSRRSSFIDSSSSTGKKTDLEGSTNRDYKRSSSYLGSSDDRRRFSYLDGTALNASSMSTTPRVPDTSLRARRSSREGTLPAGTSFGDNRISAKDIEKFRSDFRKSNETLRSKGKDVVNINSSLGDVTHNSGDLPNKNEKLIDEQRVDNVDNSLLDGNGSKQDIIGETSTQDDNSSMDGVDNNGNMKENNINNTTDDVRKYRKPESPLLFSTKESTYQPLMTNKEYSNTRRKSYISSVLDRDSDNNGSSLLKNGGGRDFMNGRDSYSRTNSLLNHGAYEELLARRLEGGRRRRSLSVTPDRSVLGKFLESERKEGTNSYQGMGILDDLNVGRHTRNRRVSRFLRPDFYDTPREESAYVKDSDNNFVEEGTQNKDVDASCSSRNNIKEVVVDCKKTKTALDLKSKNSKEQQINSNSLKKKSTRVKDTIRVLRESSLPKECDIAISESTLIKRAVSLDDCSVVGVGSSKPKTATNLNNNRAKRASSVTSDRFEPLAKIESFIKKKMCKEVGGGKGKGNKKGKNEGGEEVKTEDCLGRKVAGEGKGESILTRLSRKFSPKTSGGNTCTSSTNSRRKSSCMGGTSNGVVDLDFGVKSSKNDSLGNSCRADQFESRAASTDQFESRAARIANLKKLDFPKPHRSADSTPSCDDFDDSSLILLSPTEDNSDSWSAASDYMDARDFPISPTSHAASASSTADDSVSERIRRKSFYSRFNQLKKKKSSPTSPSSSSQMMTSRLPTYRKSMSSTLPLSSNVGNHDSTGEK